jgi:predicted nucleotidyltransferase
VVESGSRAYGFHSTDSDYDMRGIYKRRLGDYLTLEKGPDQIAFMDGNKDFVFWDIRKALRLLVASNPSLLDWISSPIVYYTLGDIHRDLIALSAEYYSRSKYFHANYGLAKQHFRKYIVNQDRVELKIYLYTIRALAACRYVLLETFPPPINFNFQSAYPDHSESLHELVSMKKAGLEKDSLSNSDFNHFIEDELARLHYHRDDFKHINPPIEHANIFFRKVIA